MNTDKPLQFRVGTFGAFIAPIIFIAGAIVYFVVFKAFDTTALTTAGIVGIVIAGVFTKEYTRFWDSVIAGLSNPIAMTVVMILFVVGPLSSLLESTGVSEGFVWLAAELNVTGGLFIAVVFIACCAMSMATGTSLGTMFTAFPIFYPAGAMVGADALLLAGAIFSGAMFGDSLAPISDTTIVSASTQRYRRREGSAEVAGVVGTRAKYALTAAGISMVLFLVLGNIAAPPAQGGSVDASGYSPLGLVMLLPVIALIVVAFWKRNLYLAITVGVISGTIVALISGLITPKDIMFVEDGSPSGFLFEGIDGMLPLIGLSIAVFGMIGIVREAGVFEIIINALSRRPWTQSARGAEAAIAVGQTITTTMFAGVVGPSIVPFSVIADEIGARASLHPYRRANVMEGFAAGIACIVPSFSAFLFIISQLTTGVEGMPAISPITVAFVSFYPIMFSAVMIFSIITGWGRRFESANGVPVKRFEDIVPEILSEPADTASAYPAPATRG
ncbi:Na+/H+ antiporter NhaC family protein [Paeniglutamicibacter cryotolerans]|uniref:Na+/H+ antiporter NhaC n=1 Tax=Paeniglutamicibacter cryotolerans TaxID=670079 RepID=A0A839QSL3_9MICC|nr:Na+/H+ antiporter NhaC family protein [Paeniglutamicibacter cryotolerans]MBB2997675.1 Na+/H+ antiporter NhaC [Paeniglutamicibacter cryotolerans]